MKLTVLPPFSPRSGLLAILAALACSATPAAAAPVAYAERMFGLSLTFPLGIYGSIELPIEVPLPLDFSLGIEAGYASIGGGGSLDLRVLAKGLLLPSLLGNPPVALAVGLQPRLLVTPAGTGFRFGLGPILSADFSPLVLSLSAFPSFGGLYGFQLEAGLGARLYLDPFAFDLSFDASTVGVFQVALGLRYLF